MEKVGLDEWRLCGDFNRRLSWQECTVLQGLSSTIEPDGHLKDKYRVICNAVHPIFAETIIKHIINYKM